MGVTFPGFSKELYYSRYALWFSSLPFPIFTSDVSLGQFLPNGVWAVICHVPLSVAKMRWQGPWGTSHCATWTTNTCIIYNQEIKEKKNHSDPATKGRRAALIMTIPSEDNLHYVSGGRQALGEEKLAVSAAEYTMLMLLEGFGEEGLWLPVQAAQRTSHQKYPWHAHRTFTTTLWQDQFLGEALASEKSLNLAPENCVLLHLSTWDS